MVTAVKPARTGNGSENGGNGDYNHSNAAVMGFKVDGNTAGDNGNALNANE